MGSIVVNYPDISDADLVFDDEETKDILTFFWPGLGSQIQSMAITNDVRRFAQTLLVAAVDASYAMGYIAILGEVLLRRKPGSSLTALVRKLSKKYVSHWWRYATRDDLLEANIYETVRLAIADKQRTSFELLRGGAGARNVRIPPSYLVLERGNRVVWG